MDEPDVDVLQRYADAFQRDHRQAGEEFYADDIVLRVPGRYRWAGVFRGRDVVVDALAAISDATQGTIGPRQLYGAAFAAGQALVRLRMGAARAGRELEWDRVIAYRVAHGRIVEITNYDYDLHAVDALFAD
jgi:ketosteroid isomerase-like protein